MSPNLSPPSDLVPLVRPVADYEPPAVVGPSPLPPLTTAVRHRPRPQPSGPPPPPRTDPHAHAAALFADAALRRVLEVIDRRRPLAQLRPLLSSGLVDSLAPAMSARPDGAARLRRVIAQTAGRGAAEVAASYSRGDRLHAIACRVEQLPAPTGARWQMVALHLG